MLAETVTLTGLDTGGTLITDFPFEKFSEDRVNGSEYMQSSSDPSRPYTFKVRHQIAKPGYQGFDRHNMSLTCYVQNIDSNGANVGNPVPVTANLTVQVPRALALGTAWTPVEMPAKNILAQICACMLNAGGARLDNATYTLSPFAIDFLAGMY